MIWNWILNLDNQLFSVLNGWHCSWLDPLMEALSSRNWLALLLLLLAALVLWRGGNRRRWALLLLVITLAVSDYVSSSIIKPAVKRVRPCNVIGAVHFLDGDRGWVVTPEVVERSWKRSWSFPSSHAANGMAVALWLGFLFRRGRYGWLTLALAIGYSRIYLGVHYPGDVLGGLLVGWLLAWLALRLYDRYGPVDRSRQSASDKT